MYMYCKRHNHNLFNYFILIIFAAIIKISDHFKLVKGNYRDDGYYRVNYDRESWKSITDQLIINHKVNQDFKSHDKLRSQILKICNYQNLYAQHSFVSTHKTIKPQGKLSGSTLQQASEECALIIINSTSIKLQLNNQQTIIKP